MNYFGRPLFLLLFLSIGSFAVSVHVTENSPQRLSFTWELGHFDTSTINYEGRVVTAIGFEGENCKVNTNGLEIVPGYTFHVGVPQSGNVNVQFSAEEMSRVQLHHPLISENSAERNDSGSERLSFTNPWVSNPSYSKFRRHRVAQMTIRPFVYNKSNKSVRVVTKGTCTITFPPGSHSGSSINRHSHYEKMLQKLLLNYKTASGWIAPKGLLRKAAVTTNPVLSFNGQKLFRFTIGDGYRNANECTIRENGILKITGTEIVERFGNAPIHSVVLYGSPKEEMSLEIPSPNAIPTALTEIPLIRYDANNNDTVDNGDFFLAYVSGTSDWTYSGSDFVFELNRYNDYRHYWLTIAPSGNGMDIPRFTQPNSTGTVYDYFQNRLYLKESRMSPKKEGGLSWIWTKLTQYNKTFEYTLPFETTELDIPGHIRIVGSTQGKVSVNFNYSDNPLPSSHWFEVPYWGDRRLRISTIGHEKQDDHFALEHIEIKHKQKIKVPNRDKPLIVFSDTIPGLIKYRLSDIGNRRVYIFRVPTDEQQISLIESVSGRDEYVWADTAGIGVRYVISTEPAFLSLPTMERVEEPRNSGDIIIRKLRSSGIKTDYIIVTHPDFLEASRKLAQHKKTPMGFNPVIVLIDDVYDQFSAGNPDPAALRNFLAYAYHHWGEGFDYVTLMGSGHYDYKGIASIEKVYIPTAQIGNRCEEDFFTYLEPETGSDRQTVFLGRITAKSNAEAEVVVNKIIEHEDPAVADFGAWRNRGLFVADDDMQGPDNDNHGEAHLSSSELISSEVGALRPSMDIRKVYLFEYKWNEIYEKPEASRAIINEINNGVSFANYFGHGAYYLWADEHVLSPDKVATLHNKKRYPVISSFSCSVGHFDKPDDECLSSILLKRDGGGAIATISSTRVSWALSNESLAKAIYGALFDNTTESISIGSALMTAKTKNTGSSKSIYAILGDPSIALTYPKRKIDMKIRTTGSTFTDTLKALQRVTITGSITDKSGALDKNFGSGNDAYVHIGFFNAPDTATRKDGKPVGTVSYILPGNPIFSGATQIHDGVFEQDVLLPRNISFDQDGIKLIAYAWEGPTTAMGHKTGIYFHGTDTNTTNITDTIGPMITVRPVYENEDVSKINHIGFSDRITSSLPFKCEIELFDESGIDVINTGPDEGLSIEVIERRENINHLFQFKEGDYRKGSATMSFEEGMIRPGVHTVKLSAQDLLGNVSKISFVLDIVDRDDLKLDHVFNYPNPMTVGQSTKIYFFHSNTAQQWNRINIRMTLRIYTLSGKLVWVQEGVENGVVWNGKDQVGNVLGPNIYLYQVTAEAPQIQKTIKSKIKKLVIHPLR